VISRIITETPGAVYAWATIPRTDHASLATEGIVFFAMIHRALDAGAGAVARARFAVTEEGALPEEESIERVASVGGEDLVPEPGLRPSVWRWGAPDGENRRWIALNRPEEESDPRVLEAETVAGLLEGVEYREIRDRVDSGSSLASEIWRAFLVAMALALLAEALLCLPPPPEPEGKAVEART